MCFQKAGERAEGRTCADNGGHIIQRTHLDELPMVCDVKNERNRLTKNLRGIKEGKKKM